MNRKEGQVWYHPRYDLLGVITGWSVMGEFLIDDGGGTGSAYMGRGWVYVGEF